MVVVVWWGMWWLGRGVCQGFSRVEWEWGVSAVLAENRDGDWCVRRWRWRWRCGGGKCDDETNTHLYEDAALVWGLNPVVIVGVLGVSMAMVGGDVRTR